MNSQPPVSGRTERVAIKKPQTTGLVLDGAHPVFRTDLTFLRLGFLACAQGQLGLGQGSPTPDSYSTLVLLSGRMMARDGEAEPWPD